MSLLMEQNNLYTARDKNTPIFEVDFKEMKKFLGLLLISGYHHLPAEKYFWSTAEDTQAPIFSATMSRESFCPIKRVLHIADI